MSIEQEGALPEDGDLLGLTYRPLPNGWPALRCAGARVRSIAVLGSGLGARLRGGAFPTAALHLLRPLMTASRCQRADVDLSVSHL